MNHFKEFLERKAENEQLLLNEIDKLKNHGYNSLTATTKKLPIQLVEQIRPDASTKYNPQPDFKFVVIEKFISVENEFAFREGLLLKAYFKLKNLRLSDEKVFGLEKSDVIVEKIPFIYQQFQKN